jgi:hypothetical protein
MVGAVQNTSSDFFGLVWFGFETGLTSNWDSAGITIVHHHSTRGLRFLIMTFYISKVAFSKYNQYTIQKI